MIVLAGQTKSEMILVLIKAVCLKGTSLDYTVKVVV